MTARARTHLSLALLCLAALAPIARGQDDSPLGRSLEWTADINAPTSEVWKKWTTVEGITSWMTPIAEVDLRVGGTIRTNYNPKGTIGDEGTIVHRILSLEPGRMISMRTEKSPAGFPHAKAIEQAWGITYFDPIDEHRTRLRLVSAGWGSGPEWDAAETFFQAGNEWTLNKLKALFPDDAAPADHAHEAHADHAHHGDHDHAAPLESAEQARATLDRVRRLIGGEWIAQREGADGGVFRVRNLSIDGPDGRSVFTRGWLGNAAGMFEHGQSQVWCEPGAGEVRFQNINEQGHVARGTIVSEGTDTIIWNWHARSGAGPGQRFHIAMTYTGPDGYDMKIERLLEDGTRNTMVEMPFERVDKAPAAFHILAPKSNGN